MSRPDIADVLEHYGVIGRRRVVPCPLHEDRTPSCSINYENNLWNCFSCGESGDSWSLIMKMEVGTFREAVEYARAVGLEGGEAEQQRFTGSAYGGRRSAPPVRGATRASYRPSWRR